MTILREKNTLAHKSQNTNFAERFLNLEFFFFLSPSLGLILVWGRVKEKREDCVKELIACIPNKIPDFVYSTLYVLSYCENDTTLLISSTGHVSKSKYSFKKS